MSAQPRVTISRVEAWLKTERLDYEIAEDGAAITDLDNCEIFVINADSEFLVVGSTWHSEFAAVDPALMAYVDEHNSTMYAPARHAEFLRRRRRLPPGRHDRFHG